MSRQPGTIQARGSKRWLVRTFVGMSAGGKRVYRSEVVHGTKAAAKRKLGSLLTGKATAVVAPTRETVGDFLERWLTDVAPRRVRDRTLRHYRDLVTRDVKPALGPLELQRLAPHQVQAMIAALADPARAPRLSARTVQMAVGVLGNALRSAERMGLVARNAARQVELPRRAQREMRRALSAEQAAKLLQALEGKPLAPLFRLAIDTGARPSELLALQWRDVDLEQRTLRIERTLAPKVKGEPWRFEAPERSLRTVVIGTTVAAELRAHRASQAESRLQLGPAYNSLDLVFATVLGTPYLLRNVVRAFKAALLEAKLPKEVRMSTSGTRPRAS